MRVRGEEWAVEKSLPLSTGGHAVHVKGLTELVRGHQAIFLDSLDEIQPFVRGARQSQGFGLAGFETDLGLDVYVVKIGDDHERAC